MAVVVDLTRQTEIVSFDGSSEEDISYATNFWQSIQLHPPMESRLVSSDIKQRLKVAPPSSQARNVQASRQEEPAVLQAFLSRARTIEHMEESVRLQRFADAKTQDKSLLVKRREERKKKEEISRDKIKPLTKEPTQFPKDEYILDEENEEDACKQITNFEQEMFGNPDSDSD